MKVILENELEKQAWEIMKAAHYKWEKNYGDSILGQMDWYFNDLHEDEVKAMVDKEARRRVEENWDLETTLDEYLSEEECEENDGVTREELVEEYNHLRGQILQRLEEEKVAVKEELRRLYYDFFNAPESLTIISANSQNKEDQKRALLQKYYEMAQHNLSCYSENYAMNKAKEGLEGEWKETKAECELLKEMMGEEANRWPG